MASRRRGQRRCLFAATLIGSDAPVQVSDAERARAYVALPGGFCPSGDRALAGVYHPARLQVLRSCQKATGTVETVRHEPDGDLHIDVALDSRYRFLLSAGNREQHGSLVVEFMARDGGHLPEPGVGQRISLIGAWVSDTQHGWNELHPVWAVSLNGSAWRRSGPQYGGSPPSDRSSDAEADCRIPSGNRCRGYGTTTARPEVTPRRSHHTSRAPRGSGGSDKNCSDFATHAQAQAYYQRQGGVGGGDPDHLDRDHDGQACESLP